MKFTQLIFNFFDSLAPLSRSLTVITSFSLSLSLFLLQKTWDSLPPMLEDRFGHTCQVMSPDPDRGVEIVASGGWQQRDSEIFQINVDTWRLGPFFDDNK